MVANLSRRVQRFVAELRRRKVFRAGVVYLVGAWAVIQAADTILPNLGVPPRAITLVIVLAAIGLPVTLFLAWIFEVGPSGVRRTDTLDQAGRAPIATSPHARLLYGAVLLAVVPLGWITWSRLRADDGVLDADLVTIIPFRVSGAAPEVAHLREGLPDLLAATIGSDTTHAAVPTRTVLAALDRRGMRQSDLIDEAARDVARELRSGTMVVGEVIQRGSTLEVVGQLVDVRSGEMRAALRASAAPDDLHVLVDRLTNQIVATLGGSPEHRLAALTSASLPALEAYLAGEAAYRLGRYDEALRHFDLAIDLDSTFALAAFGMARVMWWNPSRTPNAQRAVRLVTRYKDQLGPQDRLFVDAVVGPEFPERTTSNADMLRLRQRATTRYPQRAEFWFLLGDSYFHYGAAIGIDDHVDRALAYFDRAISIDSTYLEPLEHAAAIARIRRDTAAFRRYSDLLIAIDSSSATALIHRLTRARTLGEPAPLDADDLIARFGRDAAADLFYRATIEDPSYIPAARDAIRRAAQAAVDDDRDFFLLMARVLELTRGRDETPPVGSPDDDLDADPGTRLVRAIYLLRDLESATAAARELELAADTSDSIPIRCQLTSWYARTRNRARLEGLERWFRPDSTDSAWREDLRETCRFLHAALLESLTATTPDRPALRALDAHLQTGPPVASVLRMVANAEIARLWEELDEPERALAATRRHVLGNFWGMTAYRIEALAEEGRLAERAGERDAAVRAYSRYLQYRDSADGVFAQRAAAVRARLEALSRERSE